MRSDFAVIVALAERGVDASTMVGRMEAQVLMDSGVTLADRRRWAEGQFAAADLGDARRTRRLVTVATQMAGHSSGSIPQQTGTAADMKAAYRLFSVADVTHEAICRPHFDQTRQRAGELPMVFLAQDTTELNYTTHEHCEGFSPIGHGGEMRGLHQQNVIAVDPVPRRPLGLIYQRHHHRRERPAGQKRSQQYEIPLEERESYWWVEAVRAIGAPPAGVCWVHMGDRGEDIFGVYNEARPQGTDWLIRMARDRSVGTPNGRESLFTYVRSLPSVGQRRVTVRRQNSGATEEVELCVSAGRVTVYPSHHEAGYRGCEPIECWVVRSWEAKPPAGQEALEWILCTSLRCERPKQATFVAEGYSLRWIVEEFHKCEKTGCQVEMRRLEHIDRLEPLIGLLSVLAVWLLQLKFVARDEPARLASTLIDDLAVRVMARYLKKSSHKLTVGEFWRGIGRLGGHPGRKGDGPIGWLRAWRGWQSFQLILLGAELNEEIRKKCG